MLATHELRTAVRNAYSAAAGRPSGKHAFPVGRCFAESIGYPADLLAELPSVAYDAFAGVSCVSMFADIPSGAKVLDLGCGAGLDSLIAGRRVGKRGRVFGIDFSEVMLARAKEAACEAGAGNVEFHQADAENLPFDDASFDVALVNGIFNLNPTRNAIISELARVVRPAGVVWVAELVLKGQLAPEAKVDEANWFA
jgi:SAM-dependent methyltransferase